MNPRVLGALGIKAPSPGLLEILYINPALGHPRPKTGERGS